MLKMFTAALFRTAKNGNKPSVHRVLVDKENTVRTHNRLLFSYQKGQNLIIYDNVDRTGDVG
jgi:hypothetical protein